MDKDKGFIDSMKKLFFQSKDNPPDKKTKKNRYILMILAAGIVFMLVGNLFSDGTTTQSSIPVMNTTSSQDDVETFGQKDSVESLAISEYETKYENDLKEALESIMGVDDVTVVVNVDATETKVLEKNIITQSQTTKEKDPNGGERNVEDTSIDEQVVIVRAENDEEPIIVKIEKPVIRSVLVVASGADNIKIKQLVLEAVTKGLDVPAHKVAVMPKKTKGDS
ncbi:stage III sporulation protein AG [Bacillus sp. PS06]|uniref:stage III sporulation protein AG n=1 Tax=Bacillus sp. PS06 TaxID=2764176 RepID=UPI00178330F1|nr:stage III sporulation protein AG [Bacillus sp. PS06]MBD8070404.1 stage III sporulation protein AG [Bacillus sp. PS06]